MSKKYCECRIPMIPLNGQSIRPTVNCPLHKTLAERWDAIKSWADYYAALKVDSPEMESFEEWCKKDNLEPDLPSKSHTQKRSASAGVE